MKLATTTNNLVEASKSKFLNLCTTAYVRKEQLVHGEKGVGEGLIGVAVTIVAIVIIGAVYVIMSGMLPTLADKIKAKIDSFV